jgi:type II secretory pathway component PulM
MLNTLKNKLSFSSLMTAYKNLHVYAQYAFKGILFISISLLTYFILIYPALLGINIYNERLSQRPAELAQIQGVVKQNQLLKNKTKVAPAINELELQKIKQVFQSRDLKLTIFEQVIAENTSVIQIQLTQAAFSSALDALDALRQNWHLVPSKLDAAAGSTPGLVNITMTLKQAI